VREFINIIEANMSPRGMYAYHATFLRNIPGILEHGLIPDQEPNFDFTRARTLYASSHDGALFYADELGASFGEEMVILRFPMPEQRTADELATSRTSGSAKPSRPRQIEIESEPGGRFIPLAQYRVEHLVESRIDVPAYRYVTCCVDGGHGPGWAKLSGHGR
jgi:hypothetical protein